MRTIHPSVVIEVMLTIMLLRVNTPALNILSMIQASALPSGHHAICLGSIFHVTDMLLAAFETIRLALRQTT